MKARPYQEEAMAAVCREFQDNSSTLLVMATGLGKTVVFSSLLAKAKLGRVMVVAHREELVAQAAAKIKAITGVYPDIEMADQKVSESVFSQANVVCASVQSLTSGRAGRGRMQKFKPEKFSLVIFDECHHIQAASWQRVVNHFRQNEHVKILGVTATPKRHDGKALGATFETVAFEYGLSAAIPDGWSVPLMQQVIEVDGLDYNQVRTSAGDLHARDLAQVMEKEHHLHAVCTPSLEIIGDRKALVFAASVAAAERMCEIYNRHKPCARWLCGKTPKMERRQMIAAYAAGEFNILINVGVLTEGFDDPGIEVIVMARPTKSQGLWIQMVGRGSRTLPDVVDGVPTPEERRAAIAASDKPHCLVIDFAGNATRHNLVQAIDVLAGSDTKPEVIKKAKELARGRGEVSPGELLEEAEEELEREAQRKREAEAARRLKLKAKVKYRKRNINPFDMLDLAPVQEMGEFKREPSDKQADILSRNGIDSSGLSWTQAQEIVKTIITRSSQGLCSIKQMNLLRKYGVDATKLSRTQAGARIDAIKANGWRKSG